MNMHSVNSSTIDVIGYDEETHRLRVVVKRQKPRDFCHVPKEVYKDFCNARSKQRYYKRHILENYSS